MTRGIAREGAEKLAAGYGYARQEMSAVLPQACVAEVGADANGASAALLRHAPGLNASRAAAIVAARPSGGYKSRTELRKVKGIGPKSYEQARARESRMPSRAFA